MRFNQADLAKKLKIIQQNVSKWEAGVGTPSFAVAKKLFEMGITVEELFGFEYNKEHGLEKKEVTNDDLLREFRELKARMAVLEGKKEPPAAALGVG